MKRSALFAGEYLATDATCLVCGCTDSHACRDGCSWMLLDRAKKIGVCSTARCVRIALHRLMPKRRRR